jgi:hypothetical protein
VVLPIVTAELSGSFTDPKDSETMSYLIYKTYHSGHPELDRSWKMTRQLQAQVSNSNCNCYVSMAFFLLEQFYMAKHIKYPGLCIQKKRSEIICIPLG